MNFLNSKNKRFCHVKTYSTETTEYKNGAPNRGIYLDPQKNYFIKVN